MRGILLFIFLGLIQTCFASKYWITFTDKLNTPYSVSQPDQYLSERAIQRRDNQGINIDIKDLPVNDSYVDSIMNSGNFVLLGKSKWFNAVILDTKDTLALDSIQNYTFVNQIRQVKLFKKPLEEKIIPLEDKSIINASVVYHYPYGYGYNQLALHNAYQLQDMGFRGQGMHIAVIDAGFFNADQLDGLQHVFEDGRILSTKDFVAGGDSVYEDHYHGAAVLSVIAGKQEGVFIGSAPEASFHLLRTEDAGSETWLEEYNWVLAAEYADSVGADIINTSLGYSEFDDTLQNHTYADMDGNTTVIAIASDIAASKGILLCTSAGNSGASPWQYITTPADADSVLTVGAVDSLGIRAPFSSVGPSSDGDVKPNVCSVGWNTYMISPWANEIMQGNGTSFSSPMMAGMVACLWQALPDKSNMDIKMLVEQSSSQYNAPDSLLGFGIPDFYKIYNEQTGVEYLTPQQDIIERVFPVPFQQNTQVVYVSSNNQMVYLELLTTEGKIIYSKGYKVKTGKNLIKLEVDGMEDDVLLLRIVNADGEVDVKKLIRIG